MSIQEDNRTMIETKVCSNPACPAGGQPQPIEAFVPKRRHPDGRPRGYYSRCRRCIRDRERELRANAQPTDPVDRETTPLLPIGPWRTWLIAQLAALTEEHDRPHQVLAAQLGAHPDMVRRWRNDKTLHRIHLDTIDRALCHYREPQVLRELYPALYETDQRYELAEQRLQRLRDLRAGGLSFRKTAARFAEETGIHLSEFSTHYLVTRADPDRLPNHAIDKLAPEREPIAA